MFQTMPHLRLLRSRVSRIVVFAVVVVLSLGAVNAVTLAQAPCQTTIVVQSPPGGGPVAALAQSSGACPPAAAFASSGQPSIYTSPIGNAQTQFQSFQDRMRALNRQMGVPQHIQNQMDAMNAAMNAAIQANMAAARRQGSPTSFAPFVTVLAPPNQPRQLIIRFGSCMTIIWLGLPYRPAFYVQTVCS